MAATRDFPHADYDTWRAVVERELPDAGFDRQLTTRLLDGVTLDPLYHERSGASPRPRPRVDNLLGWHLCPRHESSRPKTANEQILTDLAGGATALWIRLDTVCRRGLDPTLPDHAGMVGRDGVAAYDIDDIARLLRGVEVPALPVLVDAGANALPAAMSLLGMLEQQGVDPRQASLHWNCDPLGTLVADGRLPATLSELRVEMRQLTSYCEAVLPQATAVTVSDLPYHHAGANTADELGLAAATLVAYLRVLDEEGLGPSVAAPRVLLRLAVGRDLFTHIAKLRAARVLWAKILTAMGLEQTPPARIHAVGSDRALTTRDPWVNMLRATTQTTASILGGADYVTTASYDRALGQASDAGRRLARGTQSVLGEESALGQVADPAGGSFYVEHLTEALARRAWETLQAVETQGGMATVIENGWLAERLSSRWSARTWEVAHRRIAITGVSEFANLTEKVPAPAESSGEHISEEIMAAASKRRRQRESDSDLQLACALDRLAVWVRTAAAGASLDEISAALPRSAGDTLEPFPRHRDSEIFEALRDRSEAAPVTPSVRLVKFGALSDHKARAIFAENLFAVGGIAVSEGETPESPVVCLCGTDRAYGEQAIATAQELRDTGVATVLLAGKPDTVSDPEAFDAFLHLGCDVLQILTRVLAALGVSDVSGEAGAPR